MKEVRNIKKVNPKRKINRSNSSRKKRQEILMTRRNPTYIPESPKSILASAFKRMRTAPIRRKMKETVNALANRMQKIKISSPVRMTPTQSRSFFTIAKPSMITSIKKLKNKVRNVGFAGGGRSGWYNLPSRIKLENAAIRHYSPSRVREGLIDPNQFNVVYRMTSNANRQKQYNNAVKNLITTYVRQVNKRQYEGDTRSKYRLLYTGIQNIANFMEALRVWQVSHLSSSNMTIDQKNAKYQNLIQKMKPVKVMSTTAFMNFNNKLTNIYDTLPSGVQKVLHLNKALVNRQTGEWNKKQAVRILQAAHYSRQMI
jgi:hypothetical protein